MEKAEENKMPEPFTIEIVLPHYVIEDFKDLAQFHNANLNEEVTRALLSYHAKMMADLINGELK